MMKRKILAGVVALSMTTSAAFAAVIDFGFSLDGSGSVGNANFATVTAALAAALDNIPVTGDNQYRIAVNQFGSNVGTIVAPTIVTAGNIGAIKTSITNAVRITGGTNTAGGISGLTALFVNAGGLNSTALFNVTTDGAASNQSAAEAAALAAFNAGVSGISLEAVGGFTNSTLENMRRISALGTNGDTLVGSALIIDNLNAIPNPLNTGFVLKVSDFMGYSAAIDAKVQRIVDPDPDPDPNQVPLPAGLPLLFLGIGALAALRRRAA